MTGSSECTHISPRKRYRVKIEGTWHEGQFSKQWFGWQFDGVDRMGPDLVLSLVPHGG